jgi:hypothetical protein
MDCLNKDSFKTVRGMLNMIYFFHVDFLIFFFDW